MNAEGKRLAKELSEARNSRGQRHYPMALKARAVKWFRERKAQGALSRDIGVELGIHPVQLAQWAREASGNSFRQFELVIPDDTHEQEHTPEPKLPGDSAPPALPSCASGGSAEVPDGRTRLTLVSPGGWQIEGLALCQLNRLIELLS